MEAGWVAQRTALYTQAALEGYPINKKPWVGHHLSKLRPWVEHPPLERKLPSTGVMERDPTAARRHCARPMPDLLDEIGDAGQCGKFISFPVD